MLYLFYSLTKDLRWFNQAARNLIIAFELPILKFIFILAGAQRSLPRNSINESDHFNVFMSDLDFTIVANKTQSDFIFSTANILRKVFLNLVEIEFYTAKEWTEIQSIQSSKYWSIWNRLYLIRKASWQSKKLSSAQNLYEKTKQNRALKITLKKLGQQSYPLNGQQIFSDLDKDDSETELPKFSLFLEHEITTDQNKKESIFFNSSRDAKSFMAILPDMNVIPKSDTLKEIKKLLIRREYLLSLASMRLKIFRYGLSDLSKDHQWLQDLDNRFLLLTK